MKVASIRILALASLASLAMATSSSAITILGFGQEQDGRVIATAAAGTTTLTTDSTLFPGSIPVTITLIAGVPLPPGEGLPAFETFIDLMSTGTATLTNGTIQQLYSGTVAITEGPNATGGNFLTATFENALLSGFATAGSAGFSGSEPPQSVTFTSNFAAIIPFLDYPIKNFSLSFQDITPGLAISGSTIRSFTATNQGGFAAVIPEPSGIVMAGTAMLASLGCIGWRHRRSSRA